MLGRDIGLPANWQHTDANQLRNECREIFIKARTLQEQAFDKWYRNLMASDEELVNKIPVELRYLSLKELVPEWYAEVPDKEKAAIQIKEANEKLSRINEIIHEAHEEAIKADLQFKAEFGGH